MLDCDRDTEPNSAGPLLSIGKEGVLYDEGSRTQATMPLNDLLVHIQHSTYCSITDRMSANPPTLANSEIGDLKEIVRGPEQMAAKLRIVDVGLLQRRSLSATIQTKLEPPDLEQVVAEATANPKAIDLRDRFR